MNSKICMAEYSNLQCPILEHFLIADRVLMRLSAVALLGLTQLFQICHIFKVQAESRDRKSSPAQVASPEPDGRGRSPAPPCR